MFARFFIDRPIFATVLSVVIVVLGLVALPNLAVEQYPEIVPPTINISTVYPGANAEVIASTVAATIEQEVNGVENMLYMLSRATNDGGLNIEVTFKLGTNLDTAQVLTQNRVAIAEPRLPEEVRRQGVVVRKRSPNMLLVVNVISPDKRYDQIYLSNYTTLNIREHIARLPGVGDINLLGARDYSMRVWLEPEKLAALNMGAGDVMASLREQNVQVAAGRIGQEPVPAGTDFQYTVRTLGRLLEPEEFGNIVIKTGEDGAITRLREVARVELGARSYDGASFLDGSPSAGMAIFPLPGANAVELAQDVRDAMDELAKSFPEGVEYRIVYDTTTFVAESIHEVYKTLIEAFVLVFLVVLLFLQDWRATLLPMIDVPVSLIGTFAVMSALGFSLNNLSLFGLVLAIGIVVDDAIVVVENVSRWMDKGLPAREATLEAMKEITGPVIAITLVLASVFIPTAFVTGISGEFYRQFGLTIAASTIISAVNAMTMAPARAVLLIKPRHEVENDREALPPLGIALAAGVALAWLLEPAAASLLGMDTSPAHGRAGWTAWAPWMLLAVIGAGLGWMLRRPINHGLLRLFDMFNNGFSRLTTGYSRNVARAIRHGVIMLVVYAGLMGVTGLLFETVPSGFIPEQDKGYLIGNVQLPDGASLSRTKEVMAHVDEILHSTPGVAHTIRLPGFSLLARSNISSQGGFFIILAPHEERIAQGLSANSIANTLRKRFMEIQEAALVVFGAPAVPGLSNTAGFKLYVQDRGDLGPQRLQAATEGLIRAGNAQPGLVGLFTSFRASQPEIYLDLDRTKAKALGVDLDDVFQTLQVYLGSAYANDFTRFGRNWQVIVQAEATERMEADDIGKLQVRNENGDMVPLGTLVALRDITGPSAISRYNMFPAAEISGASRAEVSTGEAIAMMETLARRELPPNTGIEWTEIALQERQQGNTAVFVFTLGALLVFLVLAALYESWSLPFAIVLIVPMCLLAAMAGVWITGKDNNIFTQIGFVVLIGLAAKNAILIVEFAKQLEDQGMSRLDAVVEASHVRLRPILMTSLAFLLGVLPLIRGSGAGSEMRFALGIAVFSGMLGVTFFGVFFTPVFYTVIRNLTERRRGRAREAGSPVI
ncbi:MAG TPA: multidrug efflux RND transporter permease subunit [Candidatus Binatia bacterium]|nr:multidrug efflux RND transporter permease subunit [Candidatus Binatia bacterium]